MMQNQNRIALFVGQADEGYQSRFIQGFLKEAFAEGYDVCVFSMYRKYQDTTEREQGESAIFSLMNPQKFDGVVILKDSIQTANAAQKLEKRLKEVCAKPIVVIEKESELFPSICTDCYTAVFELISHLIEVHGCRDIAFLRGKKWHKHSKERLQAFLDSMRQHGLSVSENRIIDGDFWYQSGEMCAEHLLAQEEGLPEAVACANDQMAIGLCKAFAERGIRVPEDVAVVGYDSTFEGQTSPKSVTSALIPAKEFGEYAFHFLLKEMEGKTPDSFLLKPKLVIGESCGCQETNMPHYQIKRDEWGTDISEEGYSSVFNTMSENLLLQSSLEDYLRTVYSYVYQIRGVREFHLCLSSDWKYAAQNVQMKGDSYSQKMYHAVRYSSDHKGNIAGLDQIFDTAEMLPDLYEKRNTPAAYIFTPVFFENACFGYAALQYHDMTRSYDETYRQWISSVCRGFEVLRRSLILNRMQIELEKIKNNKFTVSNLAFESLKAEEKTEYQLVRKILDDNLLDYHFQPIIRVSDGEIFAYEALMRSRTEQRISPLSIIKYAAMQERLTDVECATFLNVLRLLDSHIEDFGNALVFINSIPGVRISDEEFASASAYLKKYNRRVVVELTEEAELKDADLSRLKAYFARMQIDIAVDDYGTGYSNVSNLLRYLPNYVKIDRSLISGIQNQPQKMHFVREIIDFCHDNQIAALAEGVETAEELKTVIHLGADLIQGFYTAKPSAQLIRQIDERCKSEIRQYYQERIDGSEKKIYIAGKTNRISLSKLVKDGCTDIVIGREGMVYKDVSIIGSPKMKTDIHLQIEAGYCGQIILEDAYFSNIKNRPCIELGENSDVALHLVGNNYLSCSGIQVPESSRLVIEGEGSLNIDLNALESFGIGNTHSARHGELVFDQDGIISIKCRGKDGIGIGSGLGGTIRVERGEFNLTFNTESFVGFGSLQGDISMQFQHCHIEAECSVTFGTVIGSLDGSADILLKNCAVNYYGDGKKIVGIGTIQGENSRIEILDAGMDFNISADHSTCLGSLDGATDISAKYTSLKLRNAGQKALIFGGYNENTKMQFMNCDTQIQLRSSMSKDTFAPDENIVFINGRRRILLNGTEIERPLHFDYS